MKRTNTLVPAFVCFVVFVATMIFSVIFLRELSVWAILFGLAPFGLLQLAGLYLIVDAFCQMKAPDEATTA